jgi:plastocyanin
MWRLRPAIDQFKSKTLPRITLMNTDSHRSDWSKINDSENREQPQAIRHQCCLAPSLSIVVIAALSLVGCSKSNTGSEQPAAAPKPAAITVDAATAGSISGVVSLKGQFPKMKPLDMTADPGCPTGPQPAEVVVANAGKLANVFVYVKEGLPQGTFAVPSEPVTLDQKGCRYNPHMLGIMAGQPLKITNTDTADHNIHDMPSNNPPFNESQMPTDKPVIKKFPNAEMMIPVQCNQHPWMRAYINVMSHPYFAVSAADGSFEIKNLPPGEYTIAAVHERFGEQTMKVKVGPKENAKTAFAYSAGQ